MEAVSAKWSKVAQEAFLRVVVADEAKRAPASEAGLLRLRMQRAECEEDEQRDGYEAGTQWANVHAAYKQLRALAKWVEADGLDTEDDDSSLAGAIYHVAVDDRPNHGDIEEFWAKFSGSRSPSASFLAGFCEGAVDVVDHV